MVDYFLYSTLPAAAQPRYNRFAMENLILASCLALAGLAAAAASSDELQTAAGKITITPIQHASLLLEAGGQTIYVDPAMGSYEGRPRANLILLTDTHSDHLVPKVLAQLRQPGTVIFAPEAAAQTVAGAAIIRNGETRQFGKWSIEAIPMYNLTRGPQPGKFYHEKGHGNGYVLTYGGKRLYIAGDTEAIAEMKALRDIDVAFVPMNLPYTMPPEEAAGAVRAFHPKIVYPYHYRGSDLAVFEKALAGTGIEVRLRDWYGR
ncbi:MAG: MBL fold metallo-hydrolase [Acidobacteria bacterium]|nr:MBL fold metallo-hydrolase [Acidobacteriota bacterium]